MKLKQIPDNECSSCGGERTETKYKKTGLCDQCISLCRKNGFTPRMNGTMERDGVQLLPSGTIRIDATDANARTRSLLLGFISVEDLDDEELAMGMCKEEDGSFPLVRPAMVPKSIYDKIQQQLHKNVHRKLNSSLMNSVDTITEILEDEDTDASLRFKAATYLLERVMGKTPEIVQVSQDRPFEVLIEKLSRQRNDDGN